MYVRLGVVLGLAPAHAAGGGLNIHVKVNDEVGARQPHLYIFKVGKPVEEIRKLIIRELASLMHGVGGRVPVGEDEPAVFIYLAPIVTVGGEAVDSIKGRRGIGVDISRIGTECAAEVQAQQRAALFIIAREHDVIIVYFIIFHSLAQAAVLRGFAAAVDAFENDKLSFTHFFPSDAAEHFAELLMYNKVGFVVIRRCTQVDEHKLIAAVIIDEPRRGVDVQRRAADDEHIRIADIVDGLTQNVLIKLLLIKDDIRADDAAAVTARHTRAFVDYVRRVWLAAAGAVCAQDAAVQEKYRTVAQEIKRLEATGVAESEALNEMLRAHDTAPVEGSARLADLVRRPQLSYDDLAPFDPERPELPPVIREAVEIRMKYAGYIARQQKQVEEFAREEGRLLPESIDYLSIQGLRVEARQKLSEIRPLSVGQASRISGVSPADIAVLLIWLEQNKPSKE